MKIEIDGIELNYENSGSGRPLIMLHGNGEDLHIFDKLTARLSSHFTVYAIDSRDHGLSSRTDEISYEAMAGDIAKFIRIMDIEKPFVVGFSDGAIISLMLEIKHPGTFSDMALLGVNLSPADFKDDVLQYMTELYERTKDPLIRLMLVEPNIELDQLGRVSTRTLIVAAEKDIYKPEIYTGIVDVMPDARLEIMAGHDHGSYVLGSDVLYPVLTEFFGGSIG